MRRYLQLTITEPLEPSDDRAQIKLGVIGVDLHTGHVTLPGGFVCSLRSLVQTVYKIGIAREQWWIQQHRWGADRV